MTAKGDMKIWIFTIFLAVAFVAPLSPFFAKGNPFDKGIAYAEDEWRREFDDICAKTQDTMLLKEEELKVLIQRCDKLKPLIEKLDETQRKVFLKRLQMCRDLFAFVLESKEKK